MKVLVVFYSRTGLTKKVAESLAASIGADREEIIDTNKRAGVLGYVQSGREAMTKKLASIESPKRNSADYELVIIGTPLWAGTISSPIRAYINGQKDKFKRVAFFTTQKAGAQEKVFIILEELCGQKSLANMSVLSKDAVRGDYQEQLSNFVKQYEGNFTL